MADEKDQAVVIFAYLRHVNHRKLLQSWGILQTNTPTNQGENINSYSRGHKNRIIDTTADVLESPKKYFCHLKFFK